MPTLSIPGFYGGVSRQMPQLRLDSQVEEMFNCMTSLQDGTERRPPSVILKALSGADAIVGTTSTAFYGRIIKSATEAYLLVVTDDATSPVNIYNLSTGAKCTVTYPTSAASVRSYIGAGTSAPSAKLRSFTLEDYTFLSNNTQVVSLSTTMSAKVDPVLIFHVARGQSLTNYDATVTFSDQNQQDQTVTVTYAPAPGVVDTKVIAAGLAQRIDVAFGALASYPQFRVYVFDSYIILAKNGWVAPGAAFSTLLNGAADDGLGGGGIRCLSLENLSGASYDNFVNVVQAFEELPPRLPKGTGGYYFGGVLTAAAIDYTSQVIKIAGRSAEDYGYYVKFSGDSASWVETLRPNLSTGLNPLTLPVQIVKTAANTFEVRPFSHNGTAYELVNRLTGDDDSNPVPSLVGNVVQAAVYYKDRLGFLSGSNVILSKARSAFDFWSTTATDVLDDDPIDKEANTSGESALTLVDAIVHNGQLLVNSTGKQQFSLLSSQAILSPKSVALEPVTAFDLSTTCRPTAAGSNVYFAETNTQTGGIREFYIQDDGVTKDALNIASHIGGYLRDLKILQSYSKGNMLVMSDGLVIWIYQYLWGREGKAQSAFHTWQIDGVSVIRGLTIWDDTLYVTEGSHIWTIRLDRTDVFDGLCQFHLDHSECVTGVYDAGTDTTVFTPVRAPGSSTVAVVAITGKDLDVTIAGSTVVVDGDYSGTDVILGVPMLSYVDLSEPFIRNPQSGLAILRRPLRMKTLELAFEDTGAFNVSCIPRGTTAYGGAVQRSYPTTYFDWFHVGVDPLGLVVLKSTSSLPFPFRALLMAESRGATIRIKTDGYLPMRILNAELQYT